MLSHFPTQPNRASQSVPLAQNPDMKATLKCDTSSTRQVKCQLVDEKKLLGLIIRSDLKWVSNTENMVNKANKRLWIQRRLKYLGAQGIDLVDIYTKQIRSVLELAVPACHSGITLVEQINIERVQRCAAHIILGEDYNSYKEALKTLGLGTLKSRRDKLSLNFGKKAEKQNG